MKKILLYFIIGTCIVFGFTNQALCQEKDWIVNSYLENIKEVQDDVDKYVSQGADYLIYTRGDKDYLMPAISPKARQSLKEKYGKYDTEGKIDAAFDRLAASIAKPMQNYFPGADNFRFNNAADIKIMKTALKNISSLTIFKIGVFDSIWNIEKNAYGLPERRYKRGYVWAKDNGDDHPYCVRYEVRLIQNYAGAGTYGETFGWKDFDFRARTIMGCPAGTGSKSPVSKIPETPQTGKISEMMTKAVTAFNAGDYVEAIRLTSDVIKLKPDHEPAYFYRGGSYLNSKQYALAIADYTKAIEFSPADGAKAESTYNRSQAYLALRNSAAALTDCNSAISLNPNYYLAYFQRGNIYYNSGKTTLALKDYSKVIELKSDYALAYTYRADCYDKLGQKQLANQDRETAKSLEK